MKEISNDEVVRAYELCYVGGEGDCSICPLVDENGRCTDDEGELLRKVLEILKSKNAEIERMKKSQTPSLFGKDYRFCNLLGETLVFSKKLKDYNDMIKGLKTEAIKEFVERLKKSAFECDVSFGYGKEHFTEAVAVVEIDNLVKEMTEEQND